MAGINRMWLGIFGGTFDPPHLGHLILASEAAAQLHLDTILWVLTPDPPHKQGRAITPLAHRLAMLRAAITGNPQFELSTVDIDRPAPHYALDTVYRLREGFPDARLIYLIGGDSLVELPTWHKPQEFIHACDGIGVMQRPGELPDLHTLEQTLPGLSARLETIYAPLIEISSSEIRRRVVASDPYRYYVPDPVYAYIETHRLYKR
jgi:nicotinate-nucleotide adenylyltransferase